MNLREVRKKIKSITNVKKITRAMELVSAIKMKKAQSEEMQSKPFRDSLDEIVRRVFGRIDKQTSPLLSPNHFSFCA